MSRLVLCATLGAALCFPASGRAEDELAALIRSFRPELRNVDMEALSQRLRDPSSQVRRQAASKLQEYGIDAAPAIPALVAALDDPEQGVRTGAATALGLIGPAAQRAVPELLAALQDGDPAVRKAAAQAIARIGPDASAVPGLVAALQGSHAVKFHALRALGELGPRAAEALPAITEMLSDTAPEVRGEAALALGHIGPAARSAVPALLEAEGGFYEAPHFYEESNFFVSDNAARALAQIGVEAVAQLIAALEHENPDVQQRAAAALGYLGPDAKPAIPALTVWLKRGNIPEPYTPFADALVQLGPDVVPALVASIDDADPAVQLRAIEIVGPFGTAGKPAVPALARVLRGNDTKLSSTAAWALGRIGPSAEPAVASLVDAAGDPTLRQGALYALGTIGPSARSAVPALVEMLSHPSTEVRAQAAEALAGIGPAAEQAVPALMQALREDAGDRFPFGIAGGDMPLGPSLGRALGSVGPSTVPLLVDELDNPDELVRQCAAEALAMIGPGAQPAALALIAALDDPSVSIRRHAILGLAAIGPGAEQAVPALIGALKDRDTYDDHCGCMGFQRSIRMDAAIALGKIGRAAADAVPELIKLLDEDYRYPDVRFDALTALGEIGPAAQEAVPVLTGILEGKKWPNEEQWELWWTRVAAAAALAKIAPDSHRCVAALLAVMQQSYDDFGYGSGHAIAADALAQLGKRASAAVPYLVQIMRNENFHVSCRIQAAGAAARIDPGNDEAMDLLIHYLSDTDEFVRQEAVEVLGKLGPAAGPAVPALVRVRWDPELQFEVGEALRAIRINP